LSLVPGTAMALADPPELLSIIVPVYNEARTVRAVLDRLVAIDLPLPREILVVDDGSTDGTADVLAAAERDGLPVLVIRSAQNGGKGNALRKGLALARGTIVAIQDADLELDPAQLGALVQPILTGSTRVVYGSRFLEGTQQAAWLSVAANRLLTGVTNLLYGASLTDMETCYKIMRVDVARSLGLEANRFDIEPQITARLLRAGHHVTELPVRFEARSRAQGKKIGWRDGVRALNVLVAERFRSAR
jgi:glycosyltransferase involved in cell wall biosynthesis